MSEHAPKSHESAHSHENLVSHEHHERAEKQREAAAERAREHAKSAEQVAELRKSAEHHAKSKEDYQADRKEEPTTDHHLFGTQKKLKEDAYKQTLRATQHKLSKNNRRFSKVVHNDVVNAVSEVGAKTVARPSGILGGSIVAFIGSVVFLYYARHYGFKYNYLVLFMLFVIGFVVGALIEGLVWLVYSRRQRYQQ